MLSSHVSIIVSIAGIVCAKSLCRLCQLYLHQSFLRKAKRLYTDRFWILGFSTTIERRALSLRLLSLSSALCLDELCASGTRIYLSNIVENKCACQGHED